MNPSLRNLFMKKLTRERVVPTIPARVAWLILAMTVSGSPSLPKLASSRSTRASRFSLELNNWSTRSSSMRILRASRCCRNNSANTGSSWSTRIAATFSSRASELGDMVVQVAMRLTCPPRHPSPKKSPAPSIAMTASLPCWEITVSLTLISQQGREAVIAMLGAGDDRFPALLGDHGQFDLAFADIEDRIRRIALREDRFALQVIHVSSSRADSSQECLGVKGRFRYLRSRDARSHVSSLGRRRPDCLSELAQR